MARTPFPAFPRPVSFWPTQGDYADIECVCQDGMDLRDYFAAKAMAALVERGATNVKMTARMAYQQADAMLERREEE
jgi:hypothetical protein